MISTYGNERVGEEEGAVPARSIERAGTAPSHAQFALWADCELVLQASRGGSLFKSAGCAR